LDGETEAGAKVRKKKENKGEKIGCSLPPPPEFGHCLGQGRKELTDMA
jgi:hypothetical protein